LPSHQVHKAIDELLGLRNVRAHSIMDLTHPKKGHRKDAIHSLLIPILLTGNPDDFIAGLAHIVADNALKEEYAWLFRVARRGLKRGFR